MSHQNDTAQLVITVIINLYRKVDRQLCIIHNAASLWENRVIIVRQVYSPKFSVVFEIESNVLSFVFRNQIPFLRSVTKMLHQRIIKLQKEEKTKLEIQRNKFSHKISYHIIFILPSTDTMQDNKNSTAGTEKQQRLLLRPSQENKPAYKQKINEKSNIQTDTHTNNNSCDELTTDKTTTKNLAGT